MGAVLDRPSLLAARERWRQVSEKVVFTNGCFDLLHPGHVRLLERAKALGDRLVVAVNGDAGVQRLKGRQRPILPQTERAQLLASLAAVDAVTVFDEETPVELLAALQPDVLVKGSDWAHWIAGRDVVESAGGEVLALPVEPDYSTTDLVKKILEQLD